MGCSQAPSTADGQMVVESIRELEDLLIEG